MPSQIQPGTPAKFNYRPVRYSHISSGPGESAVLTADPWSYLHGHLLQIAAKKRGENRKNFRRATYYAGLAESFYKAGENVALPAKGTLLYYGMLNLVKSLLSTKGVPLEAKIEHHGLHLSPGLKFEVQVPASSKSRVNIFAEFAKVLGTAVTGKQTVKLEDAIGHVPELHGICHTLGFISRRKFLPIEIEFLTNTTYQYLFTEVSFSKGNEQDLPTNKFFAGHRKPYFVECPSRNGKTIFRSKKRKRLGDWETIYCNVLKDYSRFGFASLLTRNGYRYYCDLEPGSFHHLSYTLLLMFYLGTASRYRPTEVQEVMEGSLRPLVTEAIALCPKQFLYQLVSLITGRPCVIPFADI